MHADGAGLARGPYIGLHVNVPTRVDRDGAVGRHGLQVEHIKAQTFGLGCQGCHRHQAFLRDRLLNRARHLLVFDHGDQDLPRLVARTQVQDIVGAGEEFIADVATHIGDVLPRHTHLVKLVVPFLVNVFIHPTRRALQHGAAVDITHVIVPLSVIGRVARNGINLQVILVGTITIIVRLTVLKVVVADIDSRMPGDDAAYLLAVDPVHLPFLSKPPMAPAPALVVDVVAAQPGGSDDAGIVQDLKHGCIFSRSAHGILIATVGQDCQRPEPAVAVRETGRVIVGQIVGLEPGVIAIRQVILMGEVGMPCADEDVIGPVEQQIQFDTLKANVDHAVGLLHAYQLLRIDALPQDIPADVPIVTLEDVQARRIGVLVDGARISVGQMIQHILTSLMTGKEERAGTVDVAGVPQVPVGPQLLIGGDLHNVGVRIVRVLVKRAAIIDAELLAARPRNVGDDPA